MLLFENVGATQELARIIKQESGTVDDLDSRLERVSISSPFYLNAIVSVGNKQFDGIRSRE